MTWIIILLCDKKEKLVLRVNLKLTSEIKEYLNKRQPMTKY